MSTARLAALALSVTLASCAAPRANTPSLAPRAVEGRGFAEPERPAAVATPDATLDATIASRRKEFDAAAADFDRIVAARGPAVKACARAAEGTPAWFDGQTAIGEIGQAHAAIDTALAAIESLAIARAEALAPPYPALDSAIAAAQARSDAAAVAEERLRALLPN
ncbi:hypothetical protein M9980_05530 [Sphingomonas donggukensis]|uniref:Lipoprotein n=1 Tax=Sphingomonas donggukensis TaxID=2949093 RepID=A0ABY4U1L5_9SPHN|nr:hypothetical protein [Sphingomonas donggukensis]URW76671.1 hypothetical protein M9980_05530 [Sphingomonas donggukensis]